MLNNTGSVVGSDHVTLSPEDNRLLCGRVCLDGLFVCWHCAAPVLLVRMRDFQDPVLDAIVAHCSSLNAPSRHGDGLAAARSRSANVD